MSRKNPTKGNEVQHGNCVTKKLSTQRENDFRMLAIAKAQEVEKLSDKNRSFKTMPISKGYRLVEIK